MRVFLYSLLSLYLLTNCKANKITIVKDKKLTTKIDSINYTCGMLGAFSVKDYLGKDFNKNLFLQGFVDVVDSTDWLIKKKDLDKLNKITRAFLKEKSKEIKKNKQKQILVEFKEHKKQNEAFLATNKTKKGIKTTDSGLQYEVIREGKGASPSALDKVKVLYKGTLIDGKTVFDSNENRKKPSEFVLTRVILGWSEGLQLMKPGAKYKFYIPQELAYKSHQKGKDIKPFSTLVFEVELLDVIKRK